MSRIVLVTGTDTGAGKTLVSAMIVAALRARGVDVGVAKPAETGCRAIDGGLYPEDAAALAGAAGDLDVGDVAVPAEVPRHARIAAALDVVCPYRFAEPLAPALAAARAESAIDVAALVRALAIRAATHGVLLVEGAGGLLVPLTDGATYADLAQALSASVLLVVGSRLGAINHALLTLELLTWRRIAIAGYVVNRLAPDDNLAVATNTALLRSLTDARYCGELPWLSGAGALVAALRAGGAAAADAVARLATLAANHLELDAIMPSSVGT